MQAHPAMQEIERELALVSDVGAYSIGPVEPAPTREKITVHTTRTMYVIQYYTIDRDGINLVTLAGNKVFVTWAHLIDIEKELVLWARKST
jgi:hypothetical protein